MSHNGSFFTQLIVNLFYPFLSSHTHSLLLSNLTGGNLRSSLFLWSSQISNINNSTPAALEQRGARETSARGDGARAVPVAAVERAADEISRHATVSSRGGQGAAWRQGARGADEPHGGRGARGDGISRRPGSSRRLESVRSQQQSSAHGGWRDRERRQRGRRGGAGRIAERGWSGPLQRGRRWAPVGGGRRRARAAVLRRGRGGRARKGGGDSRARPMSTVNA
jgi:hypothetical protein